MKKSAILTLLLLFILVPSSVSAAARSVGIKNQLGDARKSTSGFADSPSDQISIQSTTESLEIATILGLKIKDQLDILLYYQESQNSDGGFSPTINGISNWAVTSKAISGLQMLGINSSQLNEWKIFDFVNNTASDTFYSQVTEGNDTSTVPNKLTLEQIDLWKDYILAAIQTANFPSVPIIYLLNELTNMQYYNGSYGSFDLASSSIGLLISLGQEPTDTALASKYIRAFEQPDNLFSSANNAQTSIEDTYRAISALSALNRLHELEFKNKIILKILSMQQSNNGFMENGEEQTTVSATWFAIQILLMLDALEELDSPDVLQTQGFISIDAFVVLSAIMIIPVIKRWRSKSHE